jgi:hypothetical protein
MCSTTSFAPAFPLRMATGGHGNDSKNAPRLTWIHTSSACLALAGTLHLDGLFYDMAVLNTYTLWQ